MKLRRMKGNDEIIISTHVIHRTSLTFEAQDKTGKWKLQFFFPVSLTTVTAVVATGVGC